MVSKCYIVGVWRSLEDSIADFKGKSYAKTMDRAKTMNRAAPSPLFNSGRSLYGVTALLRLS